MSNSTTEYITQAIDPAVLSVLDVELDGKVVSAQDWKTLWQLVFNRINRIDAFCVKIEDIRVSLEQSRQEMIAAAHRVDVKYAALEKSFVHYGTEAPTNEHVKFWVQPVSNVPAYLFVTGAELNRQLDIQTDTMQEAYQQYVDDAVAAGKDVLQEYVDSNLEGMSDLVSDNQDDIRSLGERTETLESKAQGLETDVKTIKQGYVSLDYIKNTYPDAQTVDRRIAEYVDPKTENIPHMEERITYAESDIINLQEGIVIIKEDYVTKKYVDDAVALSGGVSQEYVDNEIETLRHEVVTLDHIRNLQGDIDNFKDVVNNQTQNIPAIEEGIEILKDDAETFKENFKVISTSYATKKYVDDAVASGGGGTGGGVSKEYVDGIAAEAGQSINYIMENYVSVELLNQMVGVFAESYATKEYVNGLMGEIETALGGI